MVLLALATVLLAPASARCEGVRFGIGAMIGNDVLMETEGYSLSLGSSFFTVPIVFEKFKVEPEFGFHRMSADDESLTRMIMGIGVGYILARDDIRICLGAHFGMTKLTMDFDEKETLTNTYFGPLVEGEYYFGESFSVGGRLALDFQMMDDEFDLESIVATKTHGFMRWYF